MDDKDVVVTQLVDVALKFDFDSNESESAPSKVATNDIISATVAQMGGGATKSSANTLERTVHNLNVFFVRERHQATDDAGLVRHIYLDDVDLAANDSIVLKDVYLGKYIMYMVGNAGDLSKGGTVAYTAKMLENFTFGFDPNLSNTHNDWAFRGLPMFSKEVVEIKFEGDGVKPISGRLRFGVAKVNFQCNIDPAVAGITYISSVALINTANGYMPFSNKVAAVEAGNSLYSTSYNDSDTKTSIDEWCYVFPNMAGSNDLVVRAEDRTTANAPATSTYIYLRAIHINGTTGNKEVYGFFIYLGDQDVFSNFDTRAGSEYKLTVNIKGINPDNDPRISSLKVSGGSWSGVSVKIGELTTLEVTIKARNLRGQSINFDAIANPSGIAQVSGMCKIDLRDILTPADIIKSAIHFEPLQIYPLMRVDSDNFEQQYVLGFTPLIRIAGNYPLKVSVSAASGAATDMDTPALIVTN